MRIVIAEKQLRLLREAALDSFSLEELSKLRTFRAKVNYCRENLGNPIGSGSSRMVFQIDDEKVLKLAKNAKGVAQNEYEGCPDYYKEELAIFPKIFEVADDYSWIVSEYVLPAMDKDFKKCIGMSFDDWTKVIAALEKMHRNPRYQFRPSLSKEEIDELRSTKKIVYGFEEYIALYDAAVGDLYGIRNYGLAQRNGQPWIVLLDSGLSDEIYRQFYR